MENVVLYFRSPFLKIFISVIHLFVSSVNEVKLRNNRARRTNLFTVRVEAKKKTFLSLHTLLILLIENRSRGDMKDPMQKMALKVISKNITPTASSLKRFCLAFHYST